jgi:hypothetical protein
MIKFRNPQITLFILLGVIILIAVGLIINLKDIELKKYKK